MSNQIYPRCKQALLEGSIAWLTDPIYAILLDTTYYTYSPNHATLADIAAPAFLASSPILTGRTTTNGVADADAVRFDPLVGGPIVTALVLVKDGGTDITSPLLAYIDTANALPYTPDGAAILVEWSNGPSRIFAL